MSQHQHCPIPPVVVSSAMVVFLAVAFQLPDHPWLALLAAVSMAPAVALLWALYGADGR